MAEIMTKQSRSHPILKVTCLAAFAVVFLAEPASAQCMGTGGGAATGGGGGPGRGTGFGTQANINQTAFATQMVTQFVMQQQLRQRVQEMARQQQFAEMLRLQQLAQRERQQEQAESQQLSAQTETLDPDRPLTARERRNELLKQRQADRQQTLADRLAARDARLASLRSQ
ncbi:MAG: hypothetical protein KDA80_18700 [Planctomycetaceae bacterium]|nr:hypothetical protein [Planctomycetaceae bacterium]